MFFFYGHLAADATIPDDSAITTLQVFYNYWESIQMKYGLLLLLLICTASSNATAERLAGEAALCSHWDCVCYCEGVASEPPHLENPDNGWYFFYVGGTEAECPNMNGKRCLGNTGAGILVTGKLKDCEWTLVPDGECSVSDLTAGALD